MELSLTSPALLFPTISLLLLAYTNRYIAISGRIRNLHAQYKLSPNKLVLMQIRSLKLRIRLIRDMQLLGILCIFLSVFCMFLIFEEQHYWARIVFGVSLVLLMSSLGISAWETVLSTRALNIQLHDIESDSKRGNS